MGEIVNVRGIEKYFEWPILPIWFDRWSFKAIGDTRYTYISRDEIGGDFVLNNRKTINDLKEENSKLKLDIENKENSIINILEANKELALENEYLRNKIKKLKRYIEKLEGEIKKW